VRLKRELDEGRLSTAALRMVAREADQIMAMRFQAGHRRERGLGELSLDDTARSAAAYQRSPVDVPRFYAKIGTFAVGGLLSADSASRYNEKRNSRCDKLAFGS
jgi:hypothetical protein